MSNSPNTTASMKHGVNGPSWFGKFMVAAESSQKPEMNSKPMLKTESQQQRGSPGMGVKTVTALQRAGNAHNVKADYPEL